MLTKRISIALLSLFLSVAAFAAEKDLEKDITMVSYEQSWSDYEGSLALKNNTGEEVRELSFMIIYLDMSGREMDYKEFSRDVSIAPGRTRKLNIPAYEYGRQYHYYTSEGISGNTSFKIRFQLKDYAVKQESAKSTGEGIDSVTEHVGFWDEIPLDEYIWGRSDDGDRGNGGGALFSVATAVMLLPFFGIVIGIFILVGVMARKRRRSVFGWLLLSWLISPLMAILILLVIGPKNVRNDNVESHYARE